MNNDDDYDGHLLFRGLMFAFGLEIVAAIIIGTLFALAWSQQTVVAFLI